MHGSERRTDLVARPSRRTSSRPIAVSQAFVPGMVARGYGRIVNVSSEAGQLASMSTYAPAYSMSKAALNAFTRQLAAATQGTGVLVNSACPGWVRTDMGGPGAPRSVEQGADTIVWLATLDAGGPTGGFFSDRKADRLVGLSRRRRFSKAESDVRNSKASVSSGPCSA